jgi:SAM-dependent methyltransferase
MLKKLFDLLLEAYWPAWRQTVAGLAAAGLLLMGAGAFWQQWGLLPLGGLAVLAGAYHYATITWIAARLARPDRVADAVAEMGGVSADSLVAWITPAWREGAAALATRLKEGRIIVVGIYHPQRMPSRALWRLREQTPLMPLRESDPRLELVDGSADLLPWPDNSQSLLVFDEVLLELAEIHEQELLLQAALRALQPGGRLIVIERVRRPANRWILGVGESLRWPRHAVRRAQLAHLNLVIREERRINALLTAWRLDKPFNPPGQLALPLTRDPVKA